ncbi:hypothetical protein [Lacrimispora sp.]|uniref:hypothetical protein n=1 Tax=Lacrimispora sp. TaxID=2719234 RepID=UPI003995E6DB
MENIELLFLKNSNTGSKIKIKNAVVQLHIKEESNIFSGETINKIINFVNTLRKQYKGIKIPIEIYLGKIEFIDKLTYVLFECICYDLIRRGHYVQLYADVIKSIETKGIVSSPLLLLNMTTTKSVQKFIPKFFNDTFGYHFRRVIKGCSIENTNYLGKLYEEIDIFLKPFGINNDCRDEVGKVIIELVGNACEHAKTDCLIDIDVTSDYEKKIRGVSDGYTYYGINIAVVNFSNILLGDDINNNILNNSDNIVDERYKEVLRAFDNHKKMFSDEYKKEDFCNITTFQHKISGREKFSRTGGTGLTQLIKSLGKRSDTYRCYVISGNQSISFYSELLEYNSNNWVGFNSEKDYIKCIPSKEVISESLIYMPGTAYNLNFVLRGE